ncbi:COP9 signalosome complex subunit 9 [Condylostylus longicornis]|uniref:COP9 signalosome complex subunit 9 n=1 Tax=Condylostylus longicornis TaxID=2530218 RepID=UPI00244E1B18|nr:COP9 signalosome complex subunit 9 [Condylostylus longicornis]
MKPQVVDEMFPEGAGFMDLDEAGGSSGLLDLAANEKHVHADFYNDFEDIFDEDEEVEQGNNSNNSGVGSNNPQ